MRIRKLKEGLLTLNLENIPAVDEYHTEYQAKVITPIYGGGVEAGVSDESMPIRASAIRGQLRYWWRFLASKKKETPLKGEALFDAERKVWGGIGDEISASKVFLQIKLNNEVKICSPNEYSKPNQNNRAALGYALFPAIQNGHELIKHSIESEPVTFQLKIHAPKNDLDDTQWVEIQEAVRWWACFGGIGARTRRGLGAVELASIKPITLEEADNYGCLLILLHPSDDPITAWNKSIKKLQTFRQGKGLGRNAGSNPKDPKKLGRSFWPEADSIRDITHRTANGDHPVAHEATRSFPRAAFGLPIIFDFNVHSDEGEPAVTELKPIQSERMASPLILKPMSIEKGKYAPIAMRLPMGHLDTLNLELMQGRNSLQQLPRDLWWPSKESDQETKAEKVPPMKNRGANALDAFMKYFEN